MIIARRSYPSGFASAPARMMEKKKVSGSRFICRAEMTTVHQVSHDAMTGADTSQEVLVVGLFDEGGDE